MAVNVQALSESMAAVVEQAGQSVVRVDARRRYPASGIVWSADGVIVTAHHVVRRDSIVVGLADGGEVEATLAGRDPGADLAVLRVDASDLAAAAWIPEEELRVGALVLALGRPGRSVQASLGILSALGGEWHTGSGGKINHWIRPDLVMYPGFSGGPLVGADGRIVGLATSALVRDGGVALGRATVGPVVEMLLVHGQVRRGYLGVGVQTVQLPDSVAEKLGQETGLLLNRVESGGPAEAGGLLLGDVLITLDGEPVHHPEELALLLQGERVGKTVPVHIVRGGQLQEVTVTVGEH